MKNEKTEKQYNVTFIYNIGDIYITETLTEKEVKQLKKNGSFRKGIFGKMIYKTNIVKIQECN